MVEIFLAQNEDLPSIIYLMEQLGYEIPQDFISQQLQDDNVQINYIAKMDGKTVGFVSVYTRIHFQYARKVTTIDALIVDEKIRSQGIGKKLIDQVKEYGKTVNSKYIELHTNIKRKDAHRFYEDNGFVLTSNYYKYEIL